MEVRVQNAANPQSCQLDPTVVCNPTGLAFRIDLLGADIILPLTNIPEPSTLYLLLVGIVVVSTYRWRAYLYRAGSRVGMSNLLPQFVGRS